MVKGLGAAHQCRRCGRLGGVFGIPAAVQHQGSRWRAGQARQHCMCATGQLQEVRLQRRKLHNPQLPATPPSQETGQECHRCWVWQLLKLCNMSSAPFGSAKQAQWQVLTGSELGMAGQAVLQQQCVTRRGSPVEQSHGSVKGASRHQLWCQSALLDPALLRWHAR